MGIYFSGMALVGQAQAGNYRRDLIHFLILQALIFDLQGDSIAASHSLQQALDLAQPGNLIRTFLDSEPVLASLLAQIEGPYAQRLAQTFRQELQEHGQAAPIPLDLTPREYEVLQEIIAGLSNKEIEEKLFISRNTVRTHIKNLYSKLDVSSRTQAIRKARELKLV